MPVPKENNFFALAHQVVGETNAANLRQMEAASHAVVASYAAETHQKAIALVARTLRDAGQKMLNTCNELRQDMEDDPLSSVMFEGVYMQAARAVVELISIAGNIPLDVAATKAAAILKCEPVDLLSAQLAPEMQAQVAQLKAIPLATEDMQPPPTPKRRGKKALGDNQVLQ